MFTPFNSLVYEDKSHLVIPFTQLHLVTGMFLQSKTALNIHQGKSLYLVMRRSLFMIQGPTAQARLDRSSRSLPFSIFKAFCYMLHFEASWRPRPLHAARHGDSLPLHGWPPGHFLFAPHKLKFKMAFILIPGDKLALDVKGNIWTHHRRPLHEMRASLYLDLRE